MGSRLRRIIARVLVLLVLGAIVNVAVAWGFALLQDASPPALATGVASRSEDGPSAWRVIRVRQSGTDLILAIPIARVQPSLTADADEAAIRRYVELKAAQDRGESIADQLGLEVVAPPYWSGANTMPTRLGGDDFYLTEDVRGWPMRSLMCEQRRTVSDYNMRRGDVYSWALPVGGQQGPLGLPRQLPLKAIPFGFAINTIFYAMVVWMLFAAPFALRRWRRTRRGRCSACGYDLRGRETTSEGCPECGEHLPSPSR